MRLSPSRSLGARILAVALLNLTLLVALALAAAGVRVPRSVTDLVLQASTDRILDVSRQVVLEIERAPSQSADAVLSTYDARYRARFVLATNDGARVAGADIAIPGEVTQRVQRRGEPDDMERRPLPFRRMLERPLRGQALPLPEAPPFLVTTASGPKYWIGVRVPIQYAESPLITPGTLLIVSNSLVTTPLLFPARWVLWGLAALGLSLACWWPLLRGVTASLQTMERATARIAEGRFDHAVSLNVDRHDEVGRLAQSISQMALRLDALVTGQRRFLSDTAHELRSPIARLRVALELVEREASDRATSYVQDAKADVDEMSQLTDDLLHYARATLALPVLPDPLPLRAMVDRVIAREAVSTSNLHVDIAPGLSVSGQAAVLERAIANVLRNAMRYAGTSRIDITGVAHGGRVVLTIADAGPGVPVEALPRLFEPFYRVDEARTRDAGGVGLGLAIVRTAVESLGGTVTAENREPHGLSVRLSLPAFPATSVIG